jgi:ribonuclease-3
MRLLSFIDDDELLTLALTHRSYCAEHLGSSSNERLEFLGDSVLSLVVTNGLYATFPDLPEGDLTRIRADVVSSVALAPLARELGIGDALRLGRGEDNSGGRTKPSLLSDALEAVMGAVYLASGIEVVTKFIHDLTATTIAEVSQRSAYGDAKNRLQELAVKMGLDLPIYEISQHGPDHQQHFVASVEFAGAQGRGEGNSKKEAERQAAMEILAGFSSAPGA